MVRNIINEHTTFGSWFIYISVDMIYSMEGLHAPVSENLVGILIRERHPTEFKELVYSLIILLFLSEKLTFISPQTIYEIFSFSKDSRVLHSLF